jgi:hypothetical protein
MKIVHFFTKGSEVNEQEDFDNTRLFGNTGSIPPETVTIANGVVTVGGAGSYAIDTEGAAASDDCHTITIAAGGGGDTNVIRFRLVNSARTVRFQHNTSGGNIRMTMAAFTMNSIGDTIEFEAKVHPTQGLLMYVRLANSVPDT